MFNKIKILKSNGYTPDTILDIGAYHGHWTNSMLQIYPYANYTLFEAIDYVELKKLPHNINVHNILLNDKNDVVDWYEMRNTGDSMFREKTSYFANCNILKKKCYRLDEIVPILTTKNILMKIDCQGAEIPILKGAGHVLDVTDFIILELPLFGQYNMGVPNFLEHIKYMDSIGFTAYDILEDHYLNGFNIQIDMMFINKKHSFNKIVNKDIIV